MDSYYRTPNVEEAPRNIILQNRCGNRLSLMFHADRTELEFVYKPNAFRRKDLAARNFSNRDNFTALFREVLLPDVHVDFAKDFGYDPFTTRIGIQTASEARNLITVVNLADENAFALAARCPLLIALRPHKAFHAQNGLLTETVHDRGESLVSFVAFHSYEENRFRVLADGRHVLQIFENEVLLIGGEETEGQVDRVSRALKGLDLDALIARNEQILAPVLAKGRVEVRSPEMQKVLDLNRRVLYSGIDEGGACFGALNRIYHLIWVRDGAMSTALAARAGNPDPLRLWAPFLLNNPSVTRREDSTPFAQFLQIVGSRWTKWEDDGIFFAMLTLYTHYETTGDDRLLHGPEFPRVLDAVDAFLVKAWEEESGMIGSDTRGESTLTSSPYFGYDTVNGQMDMRKTGAVEGGRVLRRSHSLYNNVNTYNLLMMAAALLARHPAPDHGRRDKYLATAARLQKTIRTDFLDNKGFLCTDFLEYDDGKREWQTFAKGADYWEYVWAVALGPFFPAPVEQLRSARMVLGTWSGLRPYGYCPWNVLSRALREYGMPTAEYEHMLAEEIREALMLTQKYPMPGALTEYNKNPEGWRALPFSAGSLFFSVASLLLQSLPMGLAVRASPAANAISDFQYRLARIDARATGKGEVVDAWKLNDRAVKGTLQIPSMRLRCGPNRIDVVRGETSAEFRLFGATAELLDCAVSKTEAVYQFWSPVPAQLIFENFAKAKSVKVLHGEREGPFETLEWPDTGKTMLAVAAEGDFSVVATLGGA